MGRASRHHASRRALKYCRSARAPWRDAAFAAMHAGHVELKSSTPLIIRFESIGIRCCVDTASKNARTESVHRLHTFAPTALASDRRLRTGRLDGSADRPRLGT